MAEELTGMALREAVATALGWDIHRLVDGVAVFRRGSGKPWVACPEWESSLDACFAPGGPVERLRSDGWYFGIEVDGDWTAWFQVGEGDSRWSMAPTPAEAVCRAFLAAVNPASSTRHEEE